MPVNPVESSVRLRRASKVAIEFGNLVKAQVSQTLLSALLEHRGYRVSRLGIEELFGEVKFIDLPKYLSLNLPPQLRSLPDLLVAAVDMSKAFLVEVKFRTRFDDIVAADLKAELDHQREHWPSSYAVVMIAEPFVKDGRFHQDCIRVIIPGSTEMLVDSRFLPESRWNSLNTIEAVFKPLAPSDGQSRQADSITKIIKQLAGI
jgi:hypothetical protein